jgi:hypothetical protein
MITDCFGEGANRYLYDLQERAFIFDVLILMIAISPATIGYTVWRMLLSKRVDFRVTAVLGLNQNSEIHSESCGRGISWPALFLYVLTVAAFAFEVVELLS